MKVQAISKYIRIAPRKVWEVTREIQGLPATKALKLLEFTPRKAARLVSRTLKSAMKNAENNAQLSENSLTIKEAVVGTGPTMKAAQKQMYSRIDNIMIPNMYYRKDIGDRWFEDSDRIHNWGYLRED